LQESVAAALRGLLARHESGGNDGRAPSGVRALKQHLEEADEAIRLAQLRCRDWMKETPTLLETVVRDAARRIVSPEGARKPEGGGPVLSVLQEVLLQRGQMARETATTLQRTLAGILKSLQRSMPLVHVDPATIEEVAFDGLPAHDLESSRERLTWRRPWWASFFPRLAVWATRHGLHKHRGPILRREFEHHDQQLQAWLKSAVGQLVELYESQAEVLRQQCRRPAVEADDNVPADELQELQAELRELLDPHEMQLEGQTLGSTNGNPAEVASR
jgi:hypothetical protein